MTIFEEFANDLSADTSAGRGDLETRKEHIKELLNFFPVIGEDENGELIYRYYWNGEDVSEEQYEQNLKELFDQDQAEDIYQNIYTFEQSKALLQQMM